MEQEGSLPYSQSPATYPYLKPDRCRPSSPSSVLKAHFNKSHLRLGFPSGLLPSGLLTKTPVRNSTKSYKGRGAYTKYFTRTHVYAAGDEKSEIRYFYSKTN